MSKTSQQAEHRQVLARVNGRVQGVGFRFFVQAEAQRLDLCGWVRNLDAGGVEVLAQGPEEALKQLLARLRQGPALSYVENVAVEWRQADESLSGFQVRPTAW